MLETVKQSLKDVDVIGYVVDPTREIGAEEREALRIIKQTDAKRVLIINKIDENNKPFIDFYRDLSPEFDATVEVSSLRETNIKALIDTLFSFIPEGEYFYPEHQITNIPNAFWIA